MNDSKQGLILVGQKVHSILYGGRNGIVFAVHGQQSPDTVRTLGGGWGVTGGNAYVDVVFSDGTISKMIPEGIVRGVQWRFLDGMASALEIQQALAFAEVEKERGELAKKSQAEAFAAEVVRLRKAHPELLQLGGANTNALTTAAKNIRKELKAAFPGVTFSVKTERFSGGDAIDISWTLGPTTSAVDKIVKKYAGGSFDGMEDLYTYSRSPWTHLFGDAKYVHTRRSYAHTWQEEAVIFEKAKADYLALFAPGSVQDHEAQDFSRRILSASDLSNGFHGIKATGNDGSMTDAFIAY